METILDGTVRAAGGRFDVYFERHFDAPLERPGAAVSEPELLEGWLGGPVDELELAEGGDVVIRLHPEGPATVYGKVLRVEPVKGARADLGRAGVAERARLLRHARKVRQAHRAGAVGISGCDHVAGPGIPPGMLCRRAG